MITAERLATPALVLLGILDLLLAFVAFSYEAQPDAEQSAQVAAMPTLDTLCETLRRDGAPLLSRGEEVYGIHCLPCHGEDGNRGLANARRFGEEPFLNTEHGRGAHPLSLFHTVTRGFKKMAPQDHLSAADRIAVIHYIREQLVRTGNPQQYVPLESLGASPARPNHDSGSTPTGRSSR